MTTTDLAPWLAAPVAAGLGWLGKTLLEALKSRREERRTRRSRLEQLARLLRESRTIFFDQNKRARRLMALVQQNHPGAVSSDLGFDECFYRLYPQLADEERELQAFIRSTTEHSLRNVNERMRQWLDENPSFRDPNGPTGGKLAEELDLLELHLNQWFDKYNGVFAKDEKRSLVYLDDEKRHGARFPQSLEPVLDSALHELS